MQIKNVLLGEITPYENNPRNNDEAVEYVANSIKEFGFNVPIVVDSHGTIIAGHTRYKAALKLGLATVPVIYASDLTPDQVRAYRLADNKVSEIATWDYEALNIELGELDFDMSDFGFIEVPESEQYESEDETVPGENGYEYENQYAINILCKDEHDQEVTFQKLSDMGYDCKVVVI